MNFSFYILGTPDGRYSQYPDDYTASTLVGLQDSMTGARLVIYREMDLVHYAYTERLGNDYFIGFCLIFNKARLQKPRQLINLFRLIIEKRLVESGEIIRYTNDGELEFRIKTMNECVKDYDRLKEYINSELENNASQYGIEPLNTTYNGIKSISEVDYNASDEQIVSLTNQHNKVIVNDDSGIENGYIPQIIANLREQNQRASEEIGRLQAENKALDRKKKQFQLVVFLALAILGCGIGLFLLNDNLNVTKNELAEAKNTISIKDDSITSKNSQISSLLQDVHNLNVNLNEEKNKREQVESDFESLKSTLNEMQPFIVKRTSFSWSTGRLSFDYYGFRDATVKIQARAMGSNSYYNSSDITIQKGHHSSSIYLSSSLNSSNWYSFELLVGNKIIGGDRH